MTDLEFMRRRGRSLFPGGEITPNTLASNIAFGTAVLGANHIELTNDGAWWFVASDFDWLSSPDERYADARSLFQTVVPLARRFGAAMALHQHEHVVLGARARRLLERRAASAGAVAVGGDGEDGAVGMGEGGVDAHHPPTPWSLGQQE